MASTIKKRHKRIAKRKRQRMILIAAISIIALIAIIGFFLLSVPKYIATSATVEAGTTFRASDFLLEEGHTAEFSSDFASEHVKDGVAQVNKVGKYTMGLIVDGKEYNIKLNVQDTTAPKGSARIVVLCQGDSLTAEQCITNIKDVSNVTCTFKNKPDLSKIGQVQETVVLTDELGNSSEVPVTITVIGADECVAEQYTIEAGESFPTIEEIIALNRTGEFVTDVSAINTSLIGTHKIQVKVDGKVYSTKFLVEDTIAPTGTVTSALTIYGADFPTADKFITNIVDAGPVNVSYVTDPGATVKDQSMVQVVLTDQAGNHTTYDCECTIVHDDEAPTFLTYPEKLEIVVNENILWKSQVTAEDNYGTVDLSLDTSGVNLKKPGTYTAHFVAKDLAGNVTKQPVTLVIHEFIVTQDMMDAVCEKITNKILKDGMSTKEKLYAIYRYVSTNVRYTNDGDHENYLEIAYNGLAGSKSGDCYTFCAAAQQLIEYVGYDTQVVRRRLDLVAESGSNHVWLLVNVGTKDNPKYYHFDATPFKAPFNRLTYMMTDAQLAAYTKYRAASSPRKLHFYTFDTSLHPASATEIMVDLNIDSKYFD